MLYITKYNYATNLVGRLDLDIPAIEKDNFFKHYKLDLFDLDLNFFTKNEREALVISDRLYRNISNINRDFLFKQIRRAQQHWVYTLSMPAYHSDLKCGNLNAEFNNVLIPNSLIRSRIEEYRTYFLDNKDRYGNKPSLVEPRSFARRLIEKFDLTEDLDELLNNHILPKIQENSGVERIDLPKEQSIEEINSLIAAFEDFLGMNEISASFSRCSWLSNKPDYRCSAEEKATMKSVYEQKRVIYNRILAFHFHHFAEQGVDVSERLLEMLGFQACPNCCKHIIPF